MNAWRDGKIGQLIEEANREEEVGCILPTDQEEGGAESVFGVSRTGGFETKGEIGDLVAQGDRRFRAIFGNMEPYRSFRTSRDDGRVLGNAEPGGGDDVVMGYFVDLVASD